MTGQGASTAHGGTAGGDGTEHGGTGPSAGGQWFWCMRHQCVEEGAGCRGADRLGPYPSADAAAHWRDRVEQRNEAWQAEDDRWEAGEPPRP